MVQMNMPNEPAAAVSIDLGARAAAVTPVSACASGAEAIAYALDLIRLGRADVVAAGAEACVHLLTMSGFAQARAMSTRNTEPQRASRPFDKGRDGFVLGEGAALLVLERAEHAAARGRVPYALLAGAAVTADAHDMVSPDPAGTAQVRAIRLVLADAGLTDVTHVNAHAISTPVLRRSRDSGEVVTGFWRHPTRVGPGRPTPGGQLPQEFERVVPVDARSRALTGGRLAR
jgi:3-oxoacyl-[acyl-carrier-protein] synthase II